VRKNRQGIIVWFQHMKNLKQIKSYGNLIYVSKKWRYAVIYVNQDEVEASEDKLKKLSFVSRVERSYKPFLRTNYDNAKIDKAKEYDYKLGI